MNHTQFYKTLGKRNIVDCCHLNNKMLSVRILTSMKVETIAENKNLQCSKTSYPHKITKKALY